MAGDEFGAADGAGVEGVVGFGGGGPAFGQVGFAERVGGEPFLADGVAEAFVQDAAAAGEVFGAGGFAVEPEGQGVEDVADDGGVFQRADRA